MTERDIAQVETDGLCGPVGIRIHPGGWFDAPHIDEEIELVVLHMIDEGWQLMFITYSEKCGNSFWLTRKKPAQEHAK
jgi:hypothetical protein